MLTIAIYALISLLTFARCRHERLTDRIALSFLAPVVIARAEVDRLMAEGEG